MSRPGDETPPTAPVPPIPPVVTRTDADSDSFMKYLVVEGLDPNKPLRKLNRTLLEKTIQSITSVSAEIEWMGRALLVEVKHKSHSTNLLSLTKIGDMNVRVSAHRNLNFSKGVVRFRQAAEDLTIEELMNDINHSQRNKDLPHISEASRAIITKDGKKVQTGTFFLTFDAPTLPNHVFLGFERFTVDPYIPLPRRCFKCQRYGHGARTCRAAKDICPFCSGTDHIQNDCPNKESLKCPNCNGSHSAISKACPTYIREKRALQIQAETHCTLPEARRIAGQATATQHQANTYAGVTADGQTNIAKQNLALKEENAELREVIHTLRQENASLQQRLNEYEKRLQTLEYSMVAGEQPNTSMDGAHNAVKGAPHDTTRGGVHRISVGSSHSSTAEDAQRAALGAQSEAHPPRQNLERPHRIAHEGGTHGSTAAGAQKDAPRAQSKALTPQQRPPRMVPSHVGSSHGPTTAGTQKAAPGAQCGTLPPELKHVRPPKNAPTYVPRQSPGPKKKVEINRNPVISPMTKAAGLRTPRKGSATKPNKS